MRMNRIVLVAAAAALVPASAFAQTDSETKDLAGYLALSSTPVGALPPSAFGVDAAKTRATFDLRYGRFSYEGDFAVNGFGIGASAALAGGRIGGSLGSQTCDGCDATTMIGVDYEYSLVNGKSGQNAWAVGVQPSFGWTKAPGSDDVTDPDVNLMSLAVGVPVSISGGKAWRYTGFVTPGIGYGRVSADVDGVDPVSGNRPMLGVGARVRSVATGFGFMVGMQKVFIEDGKTQLGLGLSWTPSGR
jgi:hypothetical protein